MSKLYLLADSVRQSVWWMPEISRTWQDEVRKGGRDRVLTPRYQLKLPSFKGARLTVFTSSDSKTGGKEELL
jgi:hypothetical protein